MACLWNLPQCLRILISQNWTWEQVFELRNLTYWWKHVASWSSVRSFAQAHLFPIRKGDSVFITTFSKAPGTPRQLRNKKVFLLGQFQELCMGRWMWLSAPGSSVSLELSSGAGVRVSRGQSCSVSSSQGFAVEFWWFTFRSFASLLLKHLPS